MRKFDTQYDKRSRIATNPGRREADLFEPEFDENGHYELRKVGKVDTYSEIQSHKDSCDINVIIKRFANGDATALSKAQGTYFDATGMPQTYAEMLNTVIRAENHFNALPLEEREKFGCSFERWLSEFDRVVPAPSPTVDPAPEPVKDGE